MVEKPTRERQPILTFVTALRPGLRLHLGWSAGFRRFHQYQAQVSDSTLGTISRTAPNTISNAAQRITGP